MASVLNSKAKFYKYLPQSGEEANHSIESEADIFIKKLFQKQLDTNITLKQQLSYKKEFQSGHIYEPENKSLAGTVTLGNFLDSRTSEETPKNIEVLEDNNAENKNLSRHVRELALAVKPNSVETKLLKFAITCNAVGDVQPDNRPADHPINQLSNIEHTLFGHLFNNTNPKQTAKTILRKRRQLLESISEPIEIKRKPVMCKGKSQWDVTELIQDHKLRKNKVYSCSKERLFTIRDKKIIELKKEDDMQIKEVDAAITENNELQIYGKLSEEEIRNLPQFSNYNKGTPNETLYLKNLASSVEENDLSVLFAKYQKTDKPCITYKLMKKGRMRGQAFVNCFCVETAIEAIENLNGAYLRGKPVIIEFSSSERRNKTG